MGYTHYWRKDPELPAKSWAAFTKDVTRLVQFVKDDVGIPLNWESDDKRAPAITSDLVRFNGVGEDGHETFFFKREASKEDTARAKKDDWLRGKVFAFCKTAYKPYDIAVTAVLIAASKHFGEHILISSDGNDEGWKAGRNLVQRVLNYGADYKLPEDDE